MELTITKTTPIYRSTAEHGVFLQWNITSTSSADALFKIERAGSPEGPFEFVIDKINTYHFFDKYRHVPVPEVGDTRENLNYLSLVRSVYYRVTATTANATASAIEEIGGTLPKRQALLRRKMQRDITIAFKFNGVETAILKRRHWGIRCNICFDKLTKKVTNSKCPVCYGTGFEGGYWDPVRIKARYGAANSETGITPQGKSDTTQLRITCLSYPIVEPDDILVDIEQNQRFLVRNQAETSLRRETVHQILVISELSRDSAEYKIPVNKDHIPVIY